MKEKEAIILLACIFLPFINPVLASSIIKVKKCCKKDESFNVVQDKCLLLESSKSESKEWKVLEELQGESNLGNVETFIEIDMTETGRPKCLKDSMEKRLERLTKLMTVSNDEFLLEEENSKDNLTRSFIIHKNDLCIDKNENNELTAEFCKLECGKNLTPCLRKCCLPNQLINIDPFECINVKKDKFWSWNPIELETNNKQWILGSHQWKQRRIKSFSNATHFGQPTCKGESYEIDFRDFDRIYKHLMLLWTGDLFVESSNGRHVVIPWDQFCIDGINIENDLTQIDKVGEKNKNQFAFVCFQDEPENIEKDDALKDFRRLLYPVLTGISCLFLLCTSIIYMILWKDLNLPGWLQFSYTNSLLVAFTLLTVVQIWTDQIIQISNLLCRIVGYTLHATFLSCFFWLTSMNIDLWCSFRNTSIMTGFGRSRAKRRYFYFAGFSILLPLGVTITGIIADDYRNKIQENNNQSLMMVSTGIGNEFCALNISNKMAHLYYFYGIVGLLLVINLMFFFCTVVCLRERQRETKFAHRQCTASTSDSDLQRFKLFTRLFFIMGILWIFELVSWITSFLDLNSKVQTIFVTTDCLNALQGVGIFIMFIWKPHTWKQLIKKFRKVLKLESKASLLGPSTVKSSVKSNTKSSSISSKTLT